jgi:hypothetical protein
LAVSKAEREKAQYIVKFISSAGDIFKIFEQRKLLRSQRPNREILVAQLTELCVVSIDTMTIDLTGRTGRSFAICGALGLFIICSLLFPLSGALIDSGFYFLLMYCTKLNAPLRTIVTLLYMCYVASHYLFTRAEMSNTLFYCAEAAVVGVALLLYGYANQLYRQFMLEQTHSYYQQYRCYQMKHIEVIDEAGQVVEARYTLKPVVNFERERVELTPVSYSVGPTVSADSEALIAQAHVKVKTRAAVAQALTEASEPTEAHEVVHFVNGMQYPSLDSDCTVYQLNALTYACLDEAALLRQGASELEVGHYKHVLENCSGNRRHGSTLSEGDLGRAGVKRLNPDTTTVFFRTGAALKSAHFKLKPPPQARGIDSGARLFSQGIGSVDGRATLEIFRHRRTGAEAHR